MRPNTLRALRRYHQYLGVLFAPFLLLFAVSGIVQTFRLPDEANAPTWMKWIAAVHKDQAPPHERRPRAAQMPKSDHDHGDDHDQDHEGAKAARPNPLPLKIFVTLMSLGLIVSTLLGLAIALSNRSGRRTTIVLLIVGAVLPCVLLWL